MALLKENVLIGDEVVFRTINSYHNIVISGTVEGLCGHAIARSLDDITKYNEEVRKTITTIGDVSTQEFVLLRSGGQLKAYSLDWINADTWQTITETGDVTIVLKRATAEDVMAALNALTILNISAKVVTS
jgi:hypothetical protein